MDNNWNHLDKLQMQMKIETPEEFNDFLENPEHHSDTIILNLAIFDDRRNRYYSRIINKNKNACGCETGTVFMLIAIIMGISWLIIDFTGFTTRFFYNMLFCILFVGLFSMLGKLTGLLIAKRILKVTLKEIKQNITKHRAVNAK